MIIIITTETEYNKSMCIFYWIYVWMPVERANFMVQVNKTCKVMVETISWKK